MGKGKKLIFIGGILTLIGTYLFIWFEFSYITVQYASGIGGINNFMDLLLNNKFYRVKYGLPGWVIQIIAILMLIFLISGILQLIGKKNRKIGIVGTILPLLMGLMLVLGGMISLLAFFLRYLQIYGTTESLIEGIPIHIVIYGRASIGSFLVLAGGILGLIGFFISKEEFY